MRENWEINLQNECSCGEPLCAKSKTISDYEGRSIADLFRFGKQGVLGQGQSKVL
jgi:hypothetical protein